MYYEPSTGIEYANLNEFRLAYKNTSFGDLATETERNGAGIYTILDIPPVVDPLVNAPVAGGIEQIAEGYQRVYTLRPLSEQEIRDRLPVTCSPAQGLVALYTIKQISEQDVVTVIAAIPDPVQRYTAQIGFHRATAWERNSATMQAMAALLSLSETDLDALFSYAAGVQV